MRHQGLERHLRLYPRAEQSERQLWPSLRDDDGRKTLRERSRMQARRDCGEWTASASGVALAKKAAPVHATGPGSGQRSASTSPVLMLVEERSPDDSRAFSQAPSARRAAMSLLTSASGGGRSTGKCRELLVIV